MELKKEINKNIFREYDLRGIYPTEIDANDAYTIGRSFGTYIKELNEIETLIGHDNRHSSPELSEALIKGLRDSGMNVIDLGLVTTPMYYAARKIYKINTGIMVTASHNPKEYNGFKMSFSPIGNAYGKLITDFRDFTNKLEFDEGNGTYEKRDIRELYLEQIKNSINLNKKIRVVVDCGNGTGSIIIKDVLDKLGIEYYPLYCDSDGDFPNHHPDPSVRDNQIALANKVKELGYDFGFGVDGDADRVGIVDELKKLDIEPVMYRTGASYTNMMMQEGDFDFGGEFSGHLFFRDKYPGFDDGIYAGLRILEILSNTDKQLSELYQNINEYYSTEELRAKVTDENKFEIVEKIKEYCKEKNYKVIDIDGARIEFEDGWALVRASNTGPNLTVRFEATTPDRAQELQKEFQELIEKFSNEYK